MEHVADFMRSLKKAGIYLKNHPVYLAASVTAVVPAYVIPGVVQALQQGEGDPLQATIAIGGSLSLPISLNALVAWGYHSKVEIV